MFLGRVEDAVFVVRKVCEKYLENWKDVFWRLWIWKLQMIRSICMICGSC